MEKKSYSKTSRQENELMVTNKRFYVYPGKRDEVVIKVQKEREAGDKWWFYQQGAQDELLLTVHSPADAVIGQYYMTVVMLSPDGRIVERTDKFGFHLLFNPWCKGKT